MNVSPIRISLGIAVLAALAIADLYKNGRQATRWREYAFLAFCVGVAIAYGILNDLITSRISWEYFYYGKDLAPIIGPQTPPHPTALQFQAMRIGAAATWWAGLIIGAALLIANNPSRRMPRLKYSRLIARLPGILVITVLCAAIVGIAGDRFLLNWISQDFSELASTNLWRPHRFMTVYGIHLGGYFGGAMAVVYGISSVVMERRKISHT